MSIQTPEDEKITDFLNNMIDSLRKYDYALYDLLISSVPSPFEFYGFAVRPTTLIRNAVRVQ